MKHHKKIVVLHPIIKGVNNDAPNIEPRLIKKVRVSLLGANLLMVFNASRPITQVKTSSVENTCLGEVQYTQIFSQSFWAM